jgi:hypothetical protein
MDAAVAELAYPYYLLADVLLHNVLTSRHLSHLPYPLQPLGR